MLCTTIVSVGHCSVLAMHGTPFGCSHLLRLLFDDSFALLAFGAKHWLFTWAVSRCLTGRHLLVMGTVCRIERYSKGLQRHAGGRHGRLIQ
jgi:hypothetical protein